MIPLFAIRQISMEKMAVGCRWGMSLFQRPGRPRKTSRGNLVLARNEGPSSLASVE